MEATHNCSIRAKHDKNPKSLIGRQPSDKANNV